MSTDTLPLADFLIARLAQLGVKQMLEVPGDFSMSFLDHVDDDGRIKLIGACNELNGSYAADGWARVLQSDISAHGHEGARLSCLSTTFGVGELSAINGLAGAFSERLPVLHIVGQPGSASQQGKSILHHTLGDGNFEAFAAMSSHVSCAMSLLAKYKGQPQKLADEVDRVLSTCVREARPGYLGLPTDLVTAPVPRALLERPLALTPAPNDAAQEQACLDAIAEALAAAKRPVIVVDACTIRHGAVKEALQLVDESGLTFVATPMGKSALPEDHPSFAGIYLGPNGKGHDELRAMVEAADLYLFIGALRSDFNTASSFKDFTRQAQTIEFHSDRTQVRERVFAGVGMKELLPKVSGLLAKTKNERKPNELHQHNVLPSREAEGDAAGPNGDLISQVWLWQRIGAFFNEGDQIIAETGTSSFGLLDTTLPGGLTRFHSQVLWGSIGWATAATLGVALAARDEGLGRVHCFTGDGSLQLTAQEISTCIREGLAPVIWVLRNDGYEIERQIQGPARRYNNISPWDHKALLQALFAPAAASSAGGAEEAARASHAQDVKHVAPPQYHAVRTKAELDALLDDGKLGKDGLQLVEIFMRRGDAPQALVGQAEATAKLNA